MNAPMRPERLFRYFPPEASDLFTEKKLWVSSLKELNDPFDGLPRFDTMLEKQKQRGMEDSFTSLLKQSLVTPAHKPEFIKDMSQTSSDFFCWFAAEPVVEKFRELVSIDYRLVCFSENPDDLLMWGHYAKGHTGFIIEFNPKHQIFSTEEFGRVDYPETDERPDIERLDKRELWKMLFRKSQHWNYEKEWRLVKLTKSLPPQKERRDKKLKHFWELSADSIFSVYFGWQLPPSNRAELVESLKLPEWKDVKKFVMCPDAAKYSVQPMPFDDWLSRSKKYEEEKGALDKEIQTRTQLYA
jgi:Protein of unknown function (DUF2971)